MVGWFLKYDELIQLMRFTVKRRRIGKLKLKEVGDNLLPTERKLKE
jgi:hypothetical protein